MTEDVDNTELGKLISYIRGFAAKLEAEKIRERTVRGKRARAKAGRIVGGSGFGLYGYDYIRVSQENGGRRVINETEASWVRQMFEWLVDDGLSTNQILFRLRAHDAPTKSGKIWSRRSVQAILKYPAYAGKTYAFTALNGKLYGKPRQEWIEIPGVTPAIIGQELFDAAQKQLQVNQAKATRNCKREYLLRGHLRCRHCGRAFFGSAVHGRRRYHCAGIAKLVAPVATCKNKSWGADRLESQVWAELEHFLGDRDLILAQLETQRQDAGQLGVFEAELEHVERQVKAVDREQHQLLQWALKDFPESQVEAENRRLNKAKEMLKAQKAELETKIKASQDAVVNLPQLESFVERMHAGIANLDYQGKRLALDMLGITVCLDGEKVEVAGVLDPECCIAHTSSEGHFGQSSPFLKGGETRSSLWFLYRQSVAPRSISE
ncbi:MAG: recombinase family protein [Chloroflexi bacterium]|nr:recombinase family protein [Chloroflexota bacterium]